MFKTILLNGTKAKRVYTAVRQTVCKHCDLDIEGFSPYRFGEWRDRGNNTTCPNSGKLHQPQVATR